MPPSSSQSAPAFPVGEDTRVKLSLKTLGGIIGGVSLGVAAWYSLKADVAAHSAQLSIIQTTLGDDHDQMKVQGTLIQQQGLLLERMDRKLDYISRPTRTANGGSQ